MKRRLAGSLVFVLALCVSAAQAQILDKALQVRLTTPTAEPLRVIATFDHVPTLADRTLVGAVASRQQFLSALPMALLETNAAGITRLLGTPGLKSLYLDRKLEFYLHESVALIGADRAWRDFGADGTGVGIAIIDSGIDATHPDLPYGSKVVQNVKIAGLSAEDSPTGAGIVQVVENLPTSDTSSGHGTHCAGTAAGNGTASGGYYKGVAPGAHLVGIGTGDALFIFYALEGFDYAISHRAQYNIKVISNSWGSTMDPGEAFDPSNPVNEASKVAHDNGMTVVFASGNSGPGTDTLNRYSVAPWVIGVANGWKDGHTIEGSSSRGRYGDAFYHPTITAPGTDIVSARSPNTVLPPLGLAGNDPNIKTEWLPYYTTMTGTSMATPHVAGVAALLYQVRTDMTPDLVKRLLVNTATKMPDYEEYASGAGYVNAYAAVQQAKAIKNFKSYKDPKTGKSIPVYVTEQAYTGSVGPAAGSYNTQLATTSHEFTVAPGAIFLDSKLTWDQFVNDLDLFLTRDDGSGTYVAVAASQDTQALSQTAREGVAIDAPPAGKWRSDVRGWLNTLQTYRLTVQQYFPIQ
ncbi:MAG TPA: S8 family serine peptidase [Thermoanaerobaculia bacterium]|nr:S8 family serine peptidase [Thermoanaerobaculia bacterium]